MFSFFCYFLFSFCSFYYLFNVFYLFLFIYFFIFFIVYILFIYQLMFLLLFPQLKCKDLQLLFNVKSFWTVQWRNFCLGSVCWLCCLFIRVRTVCVYVFMWCVVVLVQDPDWRFFWVLLGVCGFAEILAPWCILGSFRWSWIDSRMFRLLNNEVISGGLVGFRVRS